MGVLVTLTGAAPGCGYDNPGFKLKDSDPVASSGAETTSVSGVTMVTTETGIMTTPPTTGTASDPSTSNGSNMSGSEISGTTVDPTTETMTTSGTTGELEPWDAECMGAEQTFTYKLVADTFFMFEEPTGGMDECDIGGQNELGLCNDISFGGSLKQQVFNYESGFPGMSDLNTRKVFVAQFEAKQILDDETNKPVPPSAVIDLTMQVFFVRIDGDALLPFNLRPVATMEPWVAGGLAAARCMTGASSWNCMACVEKDATLFCPDGKDWNGSYTEDDKPLTTFKVGGADLNVAVEIKISEQIPLEAEFEKLQDTHRGFVIVPQPGIGHSTIEVHTLDSGKAPTLTVTYCPDPNF